MIPSWPEYTDALGETGMLLAGEPLQPADIATTVRHRSGERLLVDGPFAETKEQLLGFYLLEAPDLDVVLEWAARAPHIGWGSVEVRPVPASLASSDPT